jgi:integrase
LLAFLADRYPAAKTLRAVNREMADAYIRHLQVTGKYERGIHFQRTGRRKEISYLRPAGSISAKTVNDYLGDIKQVFTTLTPDAGLPVNPFAHLSKQRAQHSEREAFTAEELQLIGQRADPFLYPLFAVGITTGLRAGDICTLRWAEVDLAGGWINREMLKTKRVVRVPLLPSLRQYLSSLPRSGELVLPDLAAMYHQNPTGITYRVKRFLASLNITSTKRVPGRSRMASTKDIHSLRHTFVYVAAASGIPLPVVQSIVGHFTPRMTQHYANHANDKLKAETIQRLPDYLGLPGSDTQPSLRPALTNEEKIAQIAALVDNERSTLAEQIQAILRK